MLRCPSRIENLLRYQDMHALQLLFLLAVKAPQKKKKKKSSTKSLELILRPCIETLALQEACCSHLLLVDLTKN